VREKRWLCLTALEFYPDYDKSIIGSLRRKGDSEKRLMFTGGPALQRNSMARYKKKMGNLSSV